MAAEQVYFIIFDGQIVGISFMYVDIDGKIIPH